MQIRNTITPAILTAATGMLQAYVPELNPKNLVAAIKLFETDTTPTVVAEKPLTRQEAAKLLSVSLNSVTRYMKDGLLKRIQIGKRLVRIDPASVRNLLTPGSEAQNV